MRKSVYIAISSATALPQSIYMAPNLSKPHRMIAESNAAMSREAPARRSGHLLTAEKLRYFSPTMREDTMACVASPQL